MSYNQTNGNYADTPLSLGTTGWRLPTDQDGEGSAANRRVVIGHSIDQLPTEGEAPLILTLEDESVLAPARDAPLLRNEDRVRDHRHKYFREIQSKLTGIGGAPGDPDEEIFKGKILPKYDIFDPNSVQAGKLELEIGEDGLAQIKKDDNPESWAERNDATWKAPVPGAKGYFNLESNKRVINDYEDKPKPTFKKKGAAGEKKHQHQLLPQGFGFLKDEEGAEGLKMRSSDVNGTSLSHIAPETLTTNGGNLNEAYFSSMHDATRLIKTNKMFSDPNESIKDEEDARIDTLIKNSQKMAETKAKSANEQFRQLLQRKKQEAEQFEIRGPALGKRDPETQQEPQVTQSEAQTVELDFRQGISLKSLIGKVGVNNTAV